MKRYVCVTLLLCLPGACVAQFEEKQPAETISDFTYPAALGVTAWRLCGTSPAARETGRRMADGILLAGLLTYGLKEVTNSSRPAPYQAEDDGFPSGHTAVAFAAAAALSAREPRATWIAFPVAAAAGWAREDLHRHNWLQVLGGAALGAYLGRQAGQGKLTLFGHSDAAVARQAAAGAVGPPNQVVVWGTSF